MSNSEKEQLSVLKNLPVLITAVSFIIGILTTLLGQSFVMGKNIATVATVAYVDQKHDEVLKYAEKLGIENRSYAEKLALENRAYADKLAAESVAKAFDHSDLNKKELSIRVESFGAKIDIMLDTVKTIQNQMYESRKR
jgi:demethoxyubiquinone hydroxylase (CLK1/Coq7/Cat5 family)